MPIIRMRTLYVSPADDIPAAVLAAMAAAVVSLHVNAYAFTRADMADVLLGAHQKGLEVGLVADRTQSTGRAQKALLQRLVDAGVPVVIATSPSGAINHEKSIMLDLVLGPHHDRSQCIYGSYNWSMGAEQQENHLQIDNDPSMCAYLFAQYSEAQAYGLAHCTQLVPSARQ